MDPRSELAPISTELNPEQEAAAMRTKLNTMREVQGKAGVPNADLDAFIQAFPDVEEDLKTLDFNTAGQTVVVASEMLDDFLADRPKRSPGFQTEVEARAMGRIDADGNAVKGWQFAEPASEDNWETIPAPREIKVDKPSLQGDLKKLGYNDQNWRPFLEKVVREGGLAGRAGYEVWDRGGDTSSAEKLLKIAPNFADIGGFSKWELDFYSDDLDWLRDQATVENLAMIAVLPHEKPAAGKPEALTEQGIALQKEFTALGYTAQNWGPFLKMVSVDGGLYTSGDKYHAERLLRSAGTFDKFIKMSTGELSIYADELDWLRESSTVERLGAMVFIAPEPKPAEPAPRLAPAAEVVAVQTESDEGAPVEQRLAGTRDRLTELEQQYTASHSDKLADLTQVREEFDLLSTAYEEAEASGDSVKVAELSGEIKLIYDAVFTEWEENYVAPDNPASSPSTSASASASAPALTAAPRSTTSAGSDAPKAAPEVPVYTAADIKDEGDFINKRMHDKGWKNYVVNPDDVGNDTTGKIVAKLPTDINDPDYKFSRIHHFLGKDESVQEIKDFSELDVTVDSKPVEWRATTEYKDGTWVNPDTGKRVGVVNGTTIEWRPKAPALVAAADVPPAPVPEPVAEPEVKEEAVAFLTERELQGKALQLKNDREVVVKLTAQRDALVAKKGKLFSNDRKLTEEIAKLDADIGTIPNKEGTYVESVRTLTAAISKQVNNPAYASVLYDVFSQEVKDKDSRLALNLPTPRPNIVAPIDFVDPSVLADATPVEPEPSSEGSPAEVVTQITPPPAGDGQIVTDANNGDPAADDGDAITDGNNGDAAPGDDAQTVG